MAWERLRAFLTIPPVVFDGCLCMVLAALGFLLSRFGTDDAAKYLSPAALWWLLSGFGLLNAIFQAVQFFRSKSFADHQQKKNETVFLTKSP